MQLRFLQTQLSNHIKILFIPRQVINEFLTGNQNSITKK